MDAICFVSIDALVILISLCCLIWFIYTSLYKTLLIYVRSSKDGNVYLVQNKPDRNEAANTFAEIVERTHKLLKELESDYQKTDSRIPLLISRFNEKNLREAVPKNKSTSYSINKGEKIVICIRNKNGKIADINTIMFVYIHELAHLMSVSIGHNTEFWQNMKFLLIHAIKYGIYSPEDYSKNPKPYCGISITDSPLKISEVPKFISSE